MRLNTQKNVILLEHESGLDQPFSLFVWVGSQDLVLWSWQLSVLLGYTKHYAIWVHKIPCHLGTQKPMLFWYTKHHATWVHKNLWYFGTQNTMPLGYTKTYAIWVHKTLLCKKTAGCSCKLHRITSGRLKSDKCLLKVQHRNQQL